MRAFRQGLGARRTRVLMGMAVALTSAALGFALARSLAARGERSSVLTLGQRPQPAALALRTQPFAARPTNAVLFVLDGFAFQHLALARLLIGGTEAETAFDRLPETGWQTVFSAHGPLTDSAASATAMATGTRTRNGLLGLDAASRPLPTIAERLVGRGVRCALVTDTILWDATPAAFVAHTRRRDRERIHQWLAASGASLLVGESDTIPPVPPGLRRTFEAGGFVVVSDLAAAARVPADTRLVLLLAPGAVSDQGRPTALGELATFALERLAARGESFFLVLESEEIDTASHHRDAPRLRRALTVAEAVLQRVLEFAARRGDTLVVVTGDHGTGGPVITASRNAGALELRFGTGDHTADLVPVLAYGPGARRFVGSRAHTAIAGDLAELLGVEP